MQSDIFGVLVVSNPAAILFLYSVWKRPELARVLAGAGFMIAGAASGAVAVLAPQAYVTGLGSHSVSIYQLFISSVLSQHPVRLVAVAAVWQAIVGLLILARDPYTRLGLFCATVFLAAAAGFGVASGFPATLIAAAGTAILVRKRWVEAPGWLRRFAPDRGIQ